MEVVIVRLRLGPGQGLTFRLRELNSLLSPSSFAVHFLSYSVQRRASQLSLYRRL
jgi:hypothetical protein